MTKKLLTALAVLAGFLQMVSAQANPYADWSHSASLYILTSPEGASLPASASEENFPLLVRLNKATFDFSQAQPNGADIRVSAEGKPLAYQVEQWDAANGTASLWVRIPLIKGNARQEIKLHWGKRDAASESSGAAVFNESNGYVCVMHLSDPVNPVKDEVGSVTPTDAGTSASPGMIGQGRRFGIGKGIMGGERITTLPTGDSPHTCEAWFRAEQSNVDILGWGNQEWQGKAVMQLASPAHMNMDCFFSDCNVAGGSQIPLSQWIHVVNTYKRGESLFYVNGVLDGSNAGGGAKGARNNRGAPLAIKSPARMYVGGWYGNYQFVGDIDEVRISKVVRSADWVKMEYESQNPRQTMVGILVQPGSVFSVSPASVTVDEGKSATVTAQAGGAQKTYWILKQGGAESVVAVDQSSYTLEAGRVVGDTSLVLQFKAVCANEVKTRNVPVTIKEAIPEPVVTLKAPSKWNGRDTIEVVPMIANLKAMKEKGAGELHYKWSVFSGAVTKEISSDKLILKRSQYTGPITVTLAVDNGGATSVATAGLKVTEPKKDAWVKRVSARDEQPEDNEFYARDDRNEGTLFYNGTVNEAGQEVFLKVYADDKLVKAEHQKPGADKSYAFMIKLKPGLIKYKVEFGTRNGAGETVLNTVTNLVCGDAYLIQGQSNALATDTGEKSPPVTSEWIRSYGRPEGGAKGPRQNLWCNPVWKAEKGEKAELGYWGMELAKRLVASEQMPIFMLNGAVGGTRIDQHQRNEADPTDLNTIYGRALWRMQQARLTYGLRGILWHQGENNQGAASPGGDYDWKSYQDYFVALSAAWKQDYPNVQHYYVFQIWPNACSMAGNSGCGDMIREIHRSLPRLYSNLSVMSTVGVKPEGGCHFPLAGWAEFARLIQPLMERDNYGKVFTNSITPPDVKHAYYTGGQRDEIALEFDQPVVWNDALTSQFYLDGKGGGIASGRVSGKVVTLKLASATGAKAITYLMERSWDPNNLLYGQNGIAALSFCQVPIGAAKPAR